MGPENHFLSSLDADDLEALRPRLSFVDLERDQLLARAGQPVANAVLPTGAVVSVVALMRDGRSVESRTIGRESGFGLLHAIGSRVSFEQVTVQIAGPAFRIPVDALAELAIARPTLLRAIVTHAQASLVQAAQMTACNALHGVDARLCAWLLRSQDRVQSDVIPLTQEHLSIMLGVQRTTVTAAASDMQERGWISYSRGKIRILNRSAIEGCTCECYEAVERGLREILKS
jgi:CRP-like cAMP-binding protein